MGCDGRDIEDAGAGEVAVQVAGEECPGVGCYGRVGIEVGVVENIGQRDGALLYRLEREDGMVDGAEAAVGDKNEWQVA